MIVLPKLAKYLNRKTVEIKSYIHSAPQKYKVYLIPKRNYGHRKIAQPAKELKVYQKAFLNLFNFPSHHCAIAYKKGLSIKNNANIHKKNAFLLKMDFINFFNSITPNFFWSSIEHILLYPKNISKSDIKDIKLLSNLEENEKIYIESLLFWSQNKKIRKNLVLSIGAPTSPSISNMCLYTFDEDVHQLCKEYNVCYSRYADDLFFSTNNKNVLSDFPKLVKNISYKRFGNKLRINDNKTIFSSKAHNRHITGVTISNKGDLSLGREKKRYIKHLIHQFTLNRLDFLTINHLKGLLAHANNIEPKFILSLKKKYGIQVLKNIKEMKNE